MIARRLLVVGFICASLFIQQAHRFAAVAAPSPTESRATSRLLAVARLWGAIDYFDPDVAGNPNVDWDGALVKNIGSIESADTTAQYAAAVQRMLATLNDPATRVIDQAAPMPTPAGPEFELLVQDGIAILRIGYLAAFAANPVGYDSTVDSFVKDAAASKGLVLDLRASRPMTIDEAAGIDNVLDPDARAPLFTGTVYTPITRSTAYSGLPTTGNADAGFYTMSFENTVGYALTGSAKTAIATSVIVNQNSEIPPLLLALIATAIAISVAEWCSN
jgi:hypothetical protein